MGSTICIILLPMFLANPSMRASTSMGQHTDNNGTLHTEIDQLRAKSGQMAEEANAQKASEKAQNETIAQLRATIQQQTKEVNV
jgi:predicted kinase